VADITIIDSWSIPFSLKTYKNNVLVQTLNDLKQGVTVQNFYDRMAAITTPPQSGLAPAVPASVWNGDKFVRIIGPTAYPPVGGLPAMPYDLFDAYLTHLVTTFGPGTKRDALVKGLGDGVIAMIDGQYNGLESSTEKTTTRQTYSLTASIDANKNITLDGNCSVVGATKMVFKASDLMNVPGIYGGNVPFVLNGTPISKPDNNVYGWICGDFFTGLAVGAVGSTAVVNGQVVGALPSELWFILKNPAMEGNFFDKLQSNPKFYNQWAAVIYANTNAYGFAYSERYFHVQAGINPATIDTLEVVLEPATVKKSVTAAVPERREA
jgi:hypothetical protein